MRHQTPKQSLVQLVIVAAIIAATAIAMFVASMIFADLQQQWSRTVAQIQVDADRNRTLIPILDELETVDEMLNARVMQEWYENPTDPIKERAALDYLNVFKERLQDRSYFLVLEPTRVYYYNDDSNKYEGKEARYTLSRDNPEDGWFFAGLALDRDLSLNVDFDRGVNALKLWINQRIYINGKPVGIAGTGFELTNFLGRFVQSVDSGFTTVFTNDQGAVQLSPNSGDIQYGVLKTFGEPDTVIFDAVSSAKERDRLRTLFQQAKSEAGRVVSARIHMGERNQLVGVAYFPSLNWFEVTRVDADKVLAPKDYLIFYLTVFVSVVAALLLILGVLTKFIFVPVGRVRALLQMPPFPEEKLALIAKELTGDYRKMGDRALELIAKERDLESRIFELERELDKARQRLSTNGLIDPVTGMLTQTSFKRALEAACAVVGRVNAPLSVLMVRPTGVELYSDGDISDRRDDRFLRHFAHSLQGVAGVSGDIIGRVNGQDFAILLPGMNKVQAEAEAGRIQRGLREQPFNPNDPGLGFLGCSVGIDTAINDALASPERLLRRAEQAVYISVGIEKGTSQTTSSE